MDIAHRERVRRTVDPDRSSTLLPLSDLKTGILLLVVSCVVVFSAAPLLFPLLLLLLLPLSS